VATGDAPLRSLRHGAGGDVPDAVFAATERLLEQMPISDLTVAQIAAEAGISRVTFYYHFTSKFAIVAALFDRIAHDLSGPFESLFDGAEQDWKPLADGIAAAWDAHGPVMRATVEHWPEVPELRDAFLRMAERSIDLIAHVIDHQREAGVALAGLDSRRLASTVLWAVVQVSYMANQNDEPITQALEPIFVMLAATLYRNEPQGDPKRRRLRAGSR
jgi:TetR/AcrR family transcriptional regulator, ethionamide resistance regulator